MPKAKKKPTNREVKSAMRVLARHASITDIQALNTLIEIQKCWSAHTILTKNGWWPTSWSNGAEWVDHTNAQEPAFSTDKENISLSDIAERYEEDDQ